MNVIVLINLQIIKLHQSHLASESNKKPSCR